jgi:erythritol kinase
MGALPEEVRLTGGAARSTALKSILASVLGVPVRVVARDEAGAAGAAMLAALALRGFADMENVMATWVTPTLGDIVVPEPDHRRLYECLFASFVETRGAMIPVWARLVALRRGEQ